MKGKIEIEWIEYAVNCDIIILPEFNVLINIMILCHSRISYMTLLLLLQVATNYIVLAVFINYNYITI